MFFNIKKTTVISKYGESSSNYNEEKSSTTSDKDLKKTKDTKTKFYHPTNDKINYDKYELVITNDSLNKWISKIYDNGVVAIDCETTSLNAVESEIVGFSMSISNSLACYIPLKHDINIQIELNHFIKIIKPILEDKSILKIGQNIKYDFVVLKNLGISIKNMDDTMLMSYVLRAGIRGHGLDELSSDLLFHDTKKYSEVTTFEKKKITFDKVEINSAKEYAAEDSDVAYRLWEKLKLLLIENKLFDFYYFIEKPLIEVIAEMELCGFKIDNKQLESLSIEFSQKIEKIEEKIFSLSGEIFNVGSPKQLGEILFIKLNIPGGKRGKSGNFQTDVKVLERLRNEKYEIASFILEWRQFSKLKNTYCEGLISRKNLTTNRIHTSFGMASTLTGRLSSNDPNLQNIPIKNIEGRQIRKAFIADNGSKIVSFDYSQIELRILAHVAKISTLINAFANDEDIHTVTAMDVFHVDREKVSKELRRKAKIINFGIIYGISPYGLASQLEISNSEAKQYMDQYFEKYPGIKDYMESTINDCRNNTFVLTPFGRRIYIPFINDKLATRRNFAERSAINAPIQGGAADLIKISMFDVFKFLKKEKLKTKLLLQVHDELLFECPTNELTFIEKEIPRLMSESHKNLLSLDVNIKVDYGAGYNWDDAH